MKKLLLLLTLTIAASETVFSQTVNFAFTGGVQTYIVPPCVFQLDIVAEGAEGGGVNGGDGATVTGSIAVTPGQVLEIRVGGMGSITAGGFNGGGIGKPGAAGSGGGGGGSDIRIAPYGTGDRVAVAGGGGGTGGGTTLGAGGSGGDPDGSAGVLFTYGQHGTGGTTIAGGIGGAPWGACGSAGTNGVLVNGGAGGTDNCYGLGPGGGGGGGLYGGGGGGADDWPSGSLGGGAGGGGSSLIPAGGTATIGSNTGNGFVSITPIGGSAPVTVTPSAPVICSGGSVVLTAAGATSYTWSPATGLSATTGATVTASPTTTQTYVLTGTTGACSTLVNVTVTVNPLPIVTATPAAPTICSGGTTAINLTSTIAGTTYAWTTSMSNVTGASAGTGATIAQTLTTTTPPTGTATYTITPTDPATGCVGAPINTVVTVDVATISGIAITNVTCNGAANGTITITSAGATQYSINGGATFSASNVFTVGPGTYNVVTQTAGGCIATGTATITEPTVLVVPMSFTDASCAGVCDGMAGTAPSGGTSPYAYSWSTGITGTPFITSACAGNYTVTVTDNNGCVQTGTTTVGGPAAVSITSITPSPVLCNGGSTGSIVIVASASATQYSINGGGTFQASGTFPGLPAGTYNIEVEDAAGCNATGITTVTEPTPLTITPSAAQTICFSQTANISVIANGGTPGYTYAWTLSGSPVGATSAVTVTPPNVGPNVYTISVTDNNSCGPVTGTVTITMNPPLSVTASADQSICPGDPASISAIGTGGNGGPYTYTWTNSVDGTILFGPDQTVNPTATSTTYTVTLADGCGTPTVTDVVIINLFALPAVSYTIDDDQGCTPVVVNFTNTTANGATFTWDFGDGSTGSGATPIHAFTQVGCWDISLTIVTNDGCTVDTVINNQICVFAIPVPEFTATPQPTDVFNPEITFTNLTMGGATYGWDFAGLGTSNATNPTFTFSSEAGATYSVCLNTMSSQGCTASVCHDVVIDDVFLLYVPNSFTPDGDGLNDIFLPVLQGNDPATYEFRIFNRWGETIFMTKNQNEGWDGTHKGIKAKEDVYVWKVKAKHSVDRKVIEKEGNINLLR